MLMPDYAPRMRVVTCRTCPNEFETRYAHTNQCDECKQNNVRGPKPLDKPDPPLTNKLPMVKEFPPELVSMIDALWLKV